MKLIYTKEQLKELAGELAMRYDWHEPDEQDVSAEVHGVEFGNAGFWPAAVDLPTHITELHVMIIHKDEPVAAVNLASLFAWATNGGA